MINGESKPSWINKVETEKFVESSKYCELIRFFVQYAVSEGQSAQGKSLSKDYKWKDNPWNPETYLKIKIDKCFFDNEKLDGFMSKSNEKDFDKKAKQYKLDSDNWFTRRNQNIIVYKKVGEKNGYISFFHHVRNCLAHGRFSVYPIGQSNDFYLVMEDGKTNKKSKQFEVSARIVVKYSALERLRRLIIDGEDRDYYCRDLIFESILRGNNTRSKVLNDLKIDKATWQRGIEKLKANGKIKYSKKSGWFVGNVGGLKNEF